MRTVDSRQEFNSFRDPSGMIFSRGGILYRQINHCYAGQYNHLMTSGLYDALVKERLLVPHKEVDESGVSEEKELVIRPFRIPYISYPYEWCFEQYRDAAATTLRAHKMALQHGMILKDASAYNIQFHKGRPVLIDTLSFELYRDNEPWVAYGQFCRHFLAPLMLMAHVDFRMSKMMQTYIDGIPLDLADRLMKKKGGLAAWQHLHLHARASEKYANSGKKDSVSTVRVKKESLINIVDSLLRTVQKQKPPKAETEWGTYYENTNYDRAAADHKSELLDRFLSGIQPVAAVWDLGANNGRYSRQALAGNAHVVAFDIDPVAVSHNYQICRNEKLNMLPLVLDLTCPSPGIGFANRERLTITERAHPDVVLMLAVIHHLCISNNLPFRLVSQWLAGIGKYCVLEFVPKTDSQVQVLLKTREDIFPNYTQECFEATFCADFEILQSEPLRDSERVMYLLKSKKL